jgi:protein involved in polysaccharide export with SLBB domain
MIPLQAGDSIQVDLTGTPGQPIPPSNFVLAGAGNINLPSLDTSIPAIGKSPNDLEKIIHDLYVPNIYTQISVTVTPGARYVYVSGEVNDKTPSGGKQLYTGKVTVLKAIAAAGGFTNFAAGKRVQLTRQDGTIFMEDCVKALKNPKLDLEVLPGDKIFVDKENLPEAWGHMFGH